MFELMKVRLKQTARLEEIVEKLIYYDYERVESVSQRGDFSQRGGIIDIYPISYNDPIRIELWENKVESIRSYDLVTGQTISWHEMFVLLPKRGVYSKVAAGVKQLEDVQLAESVVWEDASGIPGEYSPQLAVGDYVVHANHGIGRFLGVEKLKSSQTQTGNKEYMAIEYAEGDKLYVPVEERHLVQKYIGFVGRPPKLYKLGTRHWNRVKDRARRGIWSAAQGLLEMQALRRSLAGFSFTGDTDWQTQFEANFQYPQTPDQKRTTREVKKDMESAQPMDRLVCGDVGYGKTEVAFRAAFKAVINNKQVAILVPTTILAVQHYKTFKDRIGDFPILIEMLSRFKTRAEQESVLKGLAVGSVDVVVGTHRLLSDDVKFKDLGLVIVDEEQRFGVRHKEKLKQLRLLVDVLTLTATPIPRTLYMSLMGTKDMSIISTPPRGRLPIETHILEYDDEVVRMAILSEIRRKGQVYFVHNRIRGIGRLARRLSRLIPGARIAVGHGQMPEKGLEDVMSRFIDGKIDVLVSTAIIESGLDIPNVNTIIVNRADTFGAADLYQLRGRVGRFKRQAYAYFLVPQGIVLTKEAQKRLESIEKFSDLGSGFKIAMEDLQVRGAGNILGLEQHGYINAIGFDLYCRLLRETIKGLASEKLVKQ